MAASAELWDDGLEQLLPALPVARPVATLDQTQRAGRESDAGAATESAEAEAVCTERRSAALAAHAKEAAQPSVPSNQCAICLGQMTQSTRTVVEECYHSFCRDCIATWCDKLAAKAKANNGGGAGGMMGQQQPNEVAGCPLCREPIVALLHEIRSDTEFLRSAPGDVRQAAERSSAARRRRISAETQRVLTVELLDPFGPRAISRRRAIYSGRQYSHRPYQRAGLTLPASAPPSLRLPTGSAATDLLKWLRRELMVLLGVQDVETVVQYVLGLCETSGIPAPSHTAPAAGRPLCSSGRFGPSPCEAALRQFLGDRTLHFLHELYAFALSPLPLDIYDRIRCYQDQKTAAGDNVAKADGAAAEGRAETRRRPSSDRRERSRPLKDSHWRLVREEEEEAEEHRRVRKDKKRKRREQRQQDKEKRRERKRERRRDRRQREREEAEKDQDHEARNLSDGQIGSNDGGESVVTGAGPQLAVSLAAAGSAASATEPDLDELRRRRLVRLGEETDLTETADQEPRDADPAPAAAAVLSLTADPTEGTGCVPGNSRKAAALGKEAELRAACIQSMWQRMPK